MLKRARVLKNLRLAAGAVPAIMLGSMFVAFVVQVLMRYVVGQPVGWTVEVCVIAWIWIILWGQSVSAIEEEEIRFDIVYSSVKPQLRRIFRLIFSAFLVVVYLTALPATWSYVDFMKIEDTAYMDIPFNYVFFILIIFLAVSILRYSWIFFSAISGREIEPTTETIAGKDAAS